MTEFGDRRLVGPGSELQLTIDERAVPHFEVVVGEVLARAPTRKMLEEVGEGPARVNLYAAGERLAARAALPSTWLSNPSSAALRTRGRSSSIAPLVVFTVLGS